MYSISEAVSSAGRPSLTSIIESDNSGKPKDKASAWTFRSLDTYLWRSQTASELNMKIGTIFGDILGYTWLVILFAFLGLMPLSLLIVGAVNWDNCPAQTNIPLYMVVAGALGLLKLALCLIYHYKRIQSQQRLPSHIYATPSTLDGLLSVFLVGWTVLGAVWIFTPDVQFQNPKEFMTYCDCITYWSAYLYVTLTTGLICTIAVFFTVYVVRACILCNRSSPGAVIEVGPSENRASEYSLKECDPIPPAPSTMVSGEGTVQVTNM